MYFPSQVDELEQHVLYCTWRVGAELGDEEPERERQASHAQLELTPTSKQVQ